MREYGIFNSQGLLEGGFMSMLEAMDYSWKYPEDDVYVGLVSDYNHD